MTIENFLSFWSQHNIAIIESLIALVIILSLFIAYRSFFSKAAKSESYEGAGHGFDTIQIEKALQKILDNQTHQQPAQNIAAKHSEDLGMDMDLDALGSGANGIKSAEVQDLRNSLTESRKKNETLQAQLQEALQKATELAESNSASAANAGGTGTQESEDFKSKISDLEARLAEYEIISEDIADLSRYRDENEKLKKEIEALKAGAAPAQSVSDQPVATVDEGDITQTLSEASTPSPTAEPDPLADLDSALADAIAQSAGASVVEAAPLAETPEASAPAAETDAANLIDDELMKEFAAAVEGQKAMSKVEEKAGNGSEPSAETSSDTDKLMDEFENFVSKKS